MLSSRFVLLSLVFVVAGLVNASPLKEGSPTKPSFAKATPTCTQPTLSPNPEDWSSKEFIADTLPDPLGKRPMFWSGRVGTQSILPYAEDCAQRAAGGTIGMMMCEIGGFTMPNVSTEAARDLWNFSSQVFANYTVERADVMLGDVVNPNGTWRKVELPALKNNNRVAVVVQVEINTCADMCYWYCVQGAYCSVSFALLRITLF
jgi:hypothetical protein